MFEKSRFSIIFIIFYFCSSVATGATFIVNSIVDNGTGSLREAITAANNNGNTAPDQIVFALPDNTIAIKISSPLPNITGSLIIDGSTQPGPLLSVNGAKIAIECAGPFVDATGKILTRSDCFTVTNGTTDFEIYGLIIRNFYSSKPDNRFSTGDAVFVSSVGDLLVVGAADKGNVFYNNSGSIDVQGIKSSIIQNNFIGLKENGLDFSDLLQIGVAISPITSCTFGGITSAEANVCFGTSTFGTLYASVTLKIGYNIFNANRNSERSTLAQQTVTDQGYKVYLFSDQSDNSLNPPQINIDHNTWGCNLLIKNLKGADINLAQNVFGSSLDKKKNIAVNGSAVSFQNIDGKILIGGDDTDHGNIFTNVLLKDNSAGSFANGVVDASATQKIQLSHNSFYCNELSPFLYSDLSADKKPIIATIDDIGSSSVSGSTSPLADVELFYSDIECNGCQPKSYFTTVQADNTGKWIYSNTLIPGVGVLASATLNNISSEFTDTKIYLGNVKVHHATCENNGSITGIIVANSKDITWIDVNGKVVGHNPDLINIPPGSYRLITKQLNCTKYSPLFTIEKGASLAIKDNGIIISSDKCNQKNGSIHNITGFGGTLKYQYVWTNSAGQTVGKDANLDHIGTGNYTLTISDDDLCKPVQKQYFVPNENETIDAPLIPDINSCLSDVVIKIISPTVGSTYRLYNTEAGGTYLYESRNGIFDLSKVISGTYYISRLVEQCESSRAAFHIKMSNQPLKFPNAFTPNGDGINDYWKIDNIENFGQSTVDIYNRYGKNIYHSENYPKPFDGRYKNNPLPVGTYYYIISLGQGCDLIAGPISILR